MKSEAELMAELKRLQAGLSLLMDLPVNSPEAQEWAKRVLEIKKALAIKKH